MPPRAIILMANYGNDPTETAIPFTVFQEAHFEVSFATETGAVPECDSKMIKGITGSLLGATKPAIAQHDAMVQSESWKLPLSWSASDFDLLAFDLVFLPGGHDKGMRQYIDSKSLHKQLAHYVAAMRTPDSKKCLAAICHGVQVLAVAEEEAGGKSIIHDFETTALPGFMEQSIFWATRLFLGDYYKTYGAGTPSVEDIVKGRLDDAKTQWKFSSGPSPFTVHDPKFNYISARFPPDARLLAEQSIEMVKRATGYT